MIFFPDPTVQAVGLDINEHVFRLVEIRRGPFYHRAYHLYRYTEERIPDGVIVDGDFKKPDQVVVHLKNLIKKAYGHRSARGMIVSLPETKTFIKVISVKKPLKPEALDAALMTEAELHIPIPLSDLYVDWQPVDDPKKIAVGKQISVTIAAVPKKTVDEYSTALEAAGLIPLAFETEAQAIVRCIIPKDIDSSRAVGIVDFGAVRSSFIVYDKGTIQFTVSIPLSGDSVTKRISEALGVDMVEAERTKRECGVDANKCGIKLWNVMEPFLSEMSARIVDAVSFYRDHFPGGRSLDEILLSGGGANMPRIDELLSEQTKTPVRRGDPWINIEPAHTPLPQEIILSSTTAVGLAVPLRIVERGSKHPALKLNLSSPAHKETLRTRVIFAMIQRLVSVMIGAVLIASVLLFVIKVELVRNLEKVQASKLLTSDYAKVNDDVSQLNLLIGRVDALQKLEISPSSMLRDVSLRTPPGISMTALDFDIASNSMRLNGVAARREDLLAFETAMKESPFVKSLESPISNLFQKEEINFHIDIVLKVAALHEPFEPAL
jgi:type IV pilus assembly protein PilM